MAVLHELIAQQARLRLPYASRLRRELHRHPEHATEEHRTAATVARELHALGLSHARTAVTGVYTTLRGSLPGEKTIVLRADIDALPIHEEHECDYKSTIPGKMHACGHDGHTAALLTALQILQENQSRFGGTVVAVFQPGEEIGYGGRKVVAEGILEGAQRCLGIHLASDTPVGKVVLVPGPNNASVDWFRITVTGAPAHVSTPEMGADALYIASQIVVAAQALVTRRTNPTQPALIGIGKLEAGTAYNIVAAHATLEGTVRVLSPALRTQLRRELEALVQSIAGLYGGAAEMQWADYTSPVINDAAATAEVQKTAAGLFGGENVISSRVPALGGDDFAEYILRVPGVYALVGSGNPDFPESVRAHHDSRFDMDEECLAVAAALYAGYAMDFLNEP